MLVGGRLDRLAVSSSLVAERNEEAFEAFSDVVHCGVGDVELLRRSPRGEAPGGEALRHEAVVLASSECRVAEAASSVSELRHEDETRQEAAAPRRARYGFDEGADDLEDTLRGGRGG